MLRIDHISHQFVGPSGTTPALADVSFDVAPGAFVSLVGPSGCGKTTLLHIIAGLITPERGQIWLDGELIRQPQRRVGLVFQQSNLMPWRTVLDNLTLPLELAGISLPERTQQAETMIGRLGLSGFRGAFPAELSGGMAQRVAIGRAIIHDPDVLLLDEPFGALDALTREQMQIELMRIWSSARKIAMMVTHSITEAVFVSDEVIVLSPRPGRVRTRVEITLPRPRSLDMIYTPEFGALARLVRANIEEAHTNDRRPDPFEEDFGR